MKPKVWIALAVAVLAFAGCGDDIVGPLPAPPSECTCPELREYIAGLPMIGDVFSDAEVVFQQGLMYVVDAPVGPDPQYAQSINSLRESIPGNNVQKESQVGTTPEWRLFLNPDESSTQGSGIWLEDIDGVGDFDGIADPDTHNPEGVAAIEAEVIRRLADLETALRSIEENSAP